jgi:hypothetical protein
MRMIFRSGALAAMAIFGILLVFLFPPICVPFSIRPVIVFRTVLAACRLFCAISGALLVNFARRRVFYLKSMVRITVHIDYDLERFALRC